MSELQHRDAAAGRWWERSLVDGRHRQSAARLREIARAREVVVDFLAGPNQYRSTEESLQRHFDAYAMAARRADAGALRSGASGSAGSVPGGPVGGSGAPPTSQA